MPLLPILNEVTILLVPCTTVVPGYRHNQEMAPTEAMVLFNRCAGVVMGLSILSHIDYALI